MSGHTPGPWRSSYATNGIETDIYTETVPPIKVGRVSNANKDIIAASPDLYAALKTLMQYEPTREDFQIAPKGDKQFASAKADFDAARAALSKAEGKP
jgi:hypothetical protein